MEITPTKPCSDIISALHNLVIEGHKPDCSSFKAVNLRKDQFSVAIYEGKSLLACFTLHMTYDSAKQEYEAVILELEHLKSLYLLDLAE
ncbi:MAG: hypothetical protein JWM04_1013 [Verrucomicrobiales bacterium]|nr:hypothetical protein [Verrucomicrobiales bacterium]